MEPTIKTHNLQRHYHMGDEMIHALRGVDLTVRAASTSRSWARRAPASPR